jgi:hypothetical protein
MVYINNTYEQWDGFKSLNNAKKIVSFGGWGFSTEGSTYDILRRAMQPVNRDTFVKNMVAFAQAAGVDGIDIDWEYPGVCVVFHFSVPLISANTCNSYRPLISPESLLDSSQMPLTTWQHSRH